MRAERTFYQRLAIRRQIHFVESNEAQNEHSCAGRSKSYIIKGMMDNEDRVGISDSKRAIPKVWANAFGIFAFLGVLAEFGFALPSHTRSILHALEVFLFGVLVLGVLLPELLGKNRIFHFRRHALDLALLLYILLELAIFIWLSSPSASWARIVLAAQSYWIITLLVAVVRAHELLVKNNLPPLWILVGGYVGLIAVGTGLLMLPACQSGEHAPWKFIDALFVAVSASCVTGLSTRDISTELSIRGQAVVLFLIQVGGLGMVTYVMVINFLNQRKMKLQQMLAWRDMVGLGGVGELRRFIAYVVGITLLVEISGTLILAAQGTDPALNTGERLWWGAFHSISAFNNAGFSLQSNSLEGFSGSSPVLVTISLLVIIGGLGFPVLQEILRMRPSRMKTVRRVLVEMGWRFDTPVNRVSLHTKVVLCVTGCLLGGGTVLFSLAESQGLLMHLTLSDALGQSFFHAVVARTAGFNAVNIGHLQDHTLFLVMLLMAVGAAPLSTGGGVKVTTVGVVFLTVRSMFRAREQVEIFGRTVPRKMVNACVALVAIYGIAIILILTALLTTQNGLQFRDLLFESISALSTTGLSTGITSQTNDVGRLILCAAMFVGRIGPLTVLWIILSRATSLNYSYPPEELLAS